MCEQEFVFCTKFYEIFLLNLPIKGLSCLRFIWIVLFCLILTFFVTERTKFNSHSIKIWVEQYHKGFCKMQYWTEQYLKNLRLRLNGTITKQNESRHQRYKTTPQSNKSKHALKKFQKKSSLALVWTALWGGGCNGSDYFYAACIEKKKNLWVLAIDLCIVTNNFLFCRYFWENILDADNYG